MAYVVPRPKGRWEIRESRSTPKGPRSRTLVSFRVLEDEALDKALAAATQAVDRDQLLAACARAGVPRPEPRADAAARTLLAEIAVGNFPSPAVALQIVDKLSSPLIFPAAAHQVSPEWRDASPAEHGAALKELLDLTDRMPVRNKPPLRFPRISSQGRR